MNEKAAWLKTQILGPPALYSQNKMKQKNPIKHQKITANWRESKMSQTYSSNKEKEKTVW